MRYRADLCEESNIRNDVFLSAETLAAVTSVSF